MEDLNPAATVRQLCEADPDTRQACRSVCVFLPRVGAFLQPCVVVGRREPGWRFLIRASVSLILVLSQLILVISLCLVRKDRLNISINTFSSPQGFISGRRW